MAKNKAFKKAHQKGVKTLAWLALAIGAIGGTAAAGTFVGDWIAKLFDLLPWKWVPILLLIGLFVTGVIDVLIDLTPNQAALYSVMAIPSVAGATPGKAGDTIGGWFDALMGWVNDGLVQWLGTDSAVGLAIACIGGALLMARRVIKKSAGVPAGA